MGKNMQDEYFYQLVTKYVMGILHPDELDELYDLLNENDGYKKYFDFFHLSNYIKKSQPENNTYEGEQAYAALYVKMQMQEGFELEDRDEFELEEVVPNTESINFFNRSKLLLTFSLCFYIILGGIYYWYLHSNNKTDWSSKNEISTGKGNRTFVKLPDGSCVWLNSGSKLVYPKTFDIHQREVRLFGEAYFDIAKNKDRPFIIEANNIDIRVLGTAFNVRAYPNEKGLETTLLRGSIEVYSASDDTEIENKIRLQPGDKLKIVADNNMENTRNSSPTLKYSKEKINNRVNLDTMWMSNKLVFNADALSVVCTKLENWFNVKINIQNPNIKDEKFSGVFENPKFEFVLSALSQTGRFNYSVVRDSVNIK